MKIYFPDTACFSRIKLFFQGSGGTIKEPYKKLKTDSMMNLTKDFSFYLRLSPTNISLSHKCLMLTSLFEVNDRLLNIELNIEYSLEYRIEIYNRIFGTFQKNNF